MQVIRGFQSQDKNRPAFETDLEHDYKVGCISGIVNVLRHDHEIGVGRKEGIEKFVVWAVEVALGGVGETVANWRKTLGGHIVRETLTRADNRYRLLWPVGKMQAPTPLLQTAHNARLPTSERDTFS